MHKFTPIDLKYKRAVKMIISSENVLKKVTTSKNLFSYSLTDAVIYVIAIASTKFNIFLLLKKGFLNPLEITL